MIMNYGSHGEREKRRQIWNTHFQNLYQLLETGVDLRDLVDDQI